MATSRINVEVRFCDPKAVRALRYVAKTLAPLSGVIDATTARRLRNAARYAARHIRMMPQWMLEEVRRVDS